VRENCKHGSEGGDGESRFRPLSGWFSLELAWIPAFAGMTEPNRYPPPATSIPHPFLSKENTNDTKFGKQFSHTFSLTFVVFALFVVTGYRLISFAASSTACKIFV